MASSLASRSFNARVNICFIFAPFEIFQTSFYLGCTVPATTAKDYLKRFKKVLAANPCLDPSEILTLDYDTVGRPLLLGKEAGAKLLDYIKVLNGNGAPISGYAALH